MAKRRTKGTSRFTTDSLREGDKSKSKSLASSIIEQPPIPVRHTLTPMKIFATDNLDSSQSDVCEVEWDSRSPITMTQAARYKNQSVDITELVKNYAEERENTSCTPPLLDLWRDHSSDTDDGTRGVKYRVQKLQRGKGRRTRGRPSGVKAAVSSKEMLLQLESVLETKPEEDDPVLPRPAENPKRKSPRLATQSTKETHPSTSSSGTSPGEQSFDLFEATEAVYTSTQKGLPGSISLSGVLKAKNNIPHSPILKVKSPLSEKIVHQSGMGNVTPKRPSDGLDRLRSPVPGRSLNQSLEDLWTDEDLFGDDSFIIKATQGSYDGVSTPRALKRKTPQGSPEVTAEGKSGRYTFAIGSASKQAKGRVPALATTSASTTESGVPFKSYYSQNKQSKSPFRKMSPGPGARQEGSQAKQFSFVKPRAARSPLAASSHRMTTRGSQPSTAAAPPRQISTPVHTGLITHPAKPKLTSNPNSSTLPKTKPPMPKPTLNPRNVHSSVNPSVRTKPCDTAPGVRPFVHPQGPHVDVQMRQTKRATHPRLAKPSLDTSLTDELLASLAEPDDLLDSQIPSQNVELFDSQAFRDIQNDRQVPKTSVLKHNEPASVLRNPPPVSRKEPAPKVAPNETAEDLFPDDGFDDFMAEDEDEALSEPQLLAILDMVETQASQEAKTNQPKPVSDVTKVKTSGPAAQGTRRSAQPPPCQPAVRAPPVGSERLTTRGASSSGNSRGVPPVIHTTNIKQTPQPSVPVHKTTHSSVLGSRPARSSAQHLNSNVRPGHVLAKNSSGSSESPSSSSSLSSTKSDSQQVAATHGSTNPSQKCSKEEIERKKQEALKRRQNKLKLSGKMR